MFDVVVFLACRRADPEGQRGPGATLRLPYTLEGVCYTFNFGDPATEPPASLNELWLYTRFFRRRGTKRVNRRFGLEVFALNDDGTRFQVPYPVGASTSTPFPMGRIPFPANQNVVSWAFGIRDLVLPRRGQYEFRLLVRRRGPAWRGTGWEHKASHHIAVE